MKKYLTSLILAFATTSFAGDFINSSEPAAMFYYKLPLSNDTKLMFKGQRVGFTLKYRIPDDFLIQYQPPPIIDISYSGNHQAMMHINGVKIFSNSGRLYQDECTGNNCYSGAESYTGLIFITVIVSGVYLAHVITGETNY